MPVRRAAPTSLRRYAVLVLLVAASCTGGDDDADRPDVSAPTSTAAEPSAPATTSVPATAAGAVVPPASTTTAPTATSLPVDERGEPFVPTSAGEVTERLRLVLDGARGCADAPPPDDCGSLGHHHQVLVRALANEPGWRAEVLPALPAAWADVTAELVEAGTAAADSIARPLESIPAWRIRPPLPPGDLRALYERAESETGTPWEVLAAVNLVETRMGRIVGLSSAGAQGPMQFIPSTWDLYGEGGDPFADADAIAAAGRLLAATGAPDDLDAALYAYNPSEAYVEAVRGYADALAAEPRLYELLWGWQVYVLTTEGTLWLPEGFETEVPLPATEYADDAALGTS